MAKLGISKANCSMCGHGMRAEYAENCAMLEGFTPTTLGGTGDEFSSDEMKVRKKRVSERLGHSRVQVTANYFGPTPKTIKKVDADESAQPVTTELDAQTRAAGESAPVSSEAGGTEVVAPAAEAGGSVRATAIVGLPGPYYRNAPAGRKHPDDLETTPAKEKAKAKAEEEKARAAKAQSCLAISHSRQPSDR
ncbi:hypothetical protein OKW41_000319 [Paraburkholderia sp. UCT70]|uniref:hypothetical protein n=1 Tax=Paraburkholderia sp. UCT70 TaxID=2991068 RepID=UPI003D1DB3D6